MKIEVLARSGNRTLEQWAEPSALFDVIRSKDGEITSCKGLTHKRAEAALRAGGIFQPTKRGLAEFGIAAAGHRSERRPGGRVMVKHTTPALDAAEEKIRIAKAR